MASIDSKSHASLGRSDNDNKLDSPWLSVCMMLKQRSTEREILPPATQALNSEFIQWTTIYQLCRNLMEKWQ